MGVTLTVCKCTNMNKQGIQRMILFIVELPTLNHHQGI